MKRRRQRVKTYTFYDELTEPMLPTITASIPRFALPRESWVRRLCRGIGNFFAAIIKKINQLLALALAVLLLLLFTRFTLTFFHLSLSEFSYWVFFLSKPLVVPFENLLPSLPYGSYTIDVSTLIAIIIYALGVTLVRQFLRVLVSR